MDQSQWQSNNVQMSNSREINAKYLLASKELQNLYKRTVMIEPLLQILESVYSRENENIVNQLGSSIKQIRQLIGDVKIAILNVKEKKSGPFQRIIKNKSDKDYDEFERRMDKCIRILETSLIQAEQKAVQARKERNQRKMNQKNNAIKFATEENNQKKKKTYGKTEKESTEQNIPRIEIENKKYSINCEVSGMTLNDSLSEQFSFLKVSENDKEKSEKITPNDKYYKPPMQYGEKNESSKVKNTNNDHTAMSNNNGSTGPYLNGNGSSSSLSSLNNNTYMNLPLNQYSSPLSEPISEPVTENAGASVDEPFFVTQQQILNSSSSSNFNSLPHKLIVTNTSNETEIAYNYTNVNNDRNNNSNYSSSAQPTEYSSSDSYLLQTTGNNNKALPIIQTPQPQQPQQPQQSPKPQVSYNNRVSMNSQNSSTPYNNNRISMNSQMSSSPQQYNNRISMNSQGSYSQQQQQQQQQNQYSNSNGEALNLQNQYYNNYSQPTSQYYESLDRPSKLSQPPQQTPPQQYYSYDTMNSRTSQNFSQSPQLQSSSMINNNYSQSPQMINNYSQSPQQSNLSSYSQSPKSQYNSPHIQNMDMMNNNNRDTYQQQQQSPQIQKQQQQKYNNNNSATTLSPSVQQQYANLSTPPLKIQQQQSAIALPKVSPPQQISQPYISNQEETTSSPYMNTNTTNVVVNSPQVQTTNTIPLTNNNNINNNNNSNNNNNNNNNSEEATAMDQKQSEFLLNQKGLIPPTPYYALSTFTPRQPDELAIEQGDEVIIVQTFDDGWAFGRNSRTRMVGVLPMTFLGYGQYNRMEYSNNLPDRASSRRL